MKSIFDCDLCNSPDIGGGIGGWSVSCSLWNKTMTANGYKDSNYNDNIKRMLCIECFEKILGRKLTKDDFTDTQDNQTSAVVQKYFQ